MSNVTNGIPRNTILVGDVRDRLAELPADSVDCVVTSPPYFQLRDYQAPGQIGLESHVEEWVNELQLVMRGVARVLKPTGSVWLNLGDSYSRHDKFGGRPKSLLLGPERLVLRLAEDGWIVRNKVVWAKSNTLPSSVKDRLSCTWEVVYFLTRERFYHFDLDAIRVPHRSKTTHPHASATVRDVGRPKWAGPLAGDNGGLARMKAAGVIGNPLGKNPGDVWTLAASNFRGAHHATFPPSLVVQPLLATCPERVCVRCGVPWQREPTRKQEHHGKQHAVRGELQVQCRCKAASQPGVVLDPFFGAGTVGVVAEAHGRDWIGIEINPKFAALAEKRLVAERKRRVDGQS